MFLTPEEVNKRREEQRKIELIHIIKTFSRQIEDCLANGCLIFYDYDCAHLIDTINPDINKTIRDELKEKGWKIEPRMTKIKVWNWRKFRKVETEVHSKGFYNLVPV